MSSPADDSLMAILPEDYGVIRPLFEIINDLDRSPDRWEMWAARWPVPNPGDDLDDEDDWQPVPLDERGTR